MADIYVDDGSGKEAVVCVTTQDLSVHETDSVAGASLVTATTAGARYELYMPAHKTGTRHRTSERLMSVDDVREAAFPGRAARGGGQRPGGFNAWRFFPTSRSAVSSKASKDIERELSATSQAVVPLCSKIVPLIGAAGSAAGS